MKELRTFHFVQMLYTKFGQNVFKIEKKNQHLAYARNPQKNTASGK